MDVGQVVTVELSVTLHAGVGNRPVEGCFHLKFTSEVLGSEFGAQGGEMRMSHVHQPQLAYVQSASGVVLVDQAPFQSSRAQVQ